MYMSEMPLQKVLHDFFAAENIESFAPVPADKCVFNADKLRRARVDFVPASALVFVLPYFVRRGENLSAYATSKDYHLFAAQLAPRLTACLQQACPEGHFRVFCDNSPLDERRAAVAAGLGVLGDNGLLITHRWGSFVFIGEILSDREAAEFGPICPPQKTDCLHCGACRRACPTGCLSDYSRPCLSALTQQKAPYTPEEAAIVKAAGSVWGCDVCQLACPLNRPQGGLPVSPIPFFSEERIERLDRATLNALDDAAFAARAFSWRGRAVPQRNIDLLYPPSETISSPDDAHYDLQHPHIHQKRRTEG